MIHLELRKLLEEQTGTLLLIAGGFLLIEIVIRALPNFAGFTVQGAPLGWASFLLSTGTIGLIGRALPFVALVGLYHRLTTETPRLAAVGGTLMALTPVLFVSGLLSMLIQPLPEVPYLLFLSPLPYIVGAGSFGLAFFWKDGSIRFVGIPLLGFSGTWALLYAVGLKNGELPGGLPSTELLAVSLVTMGYLLYTNSTTHDNGVPAGG